STPCVFVQSQRDGGGPPPQRWPQVKRLVVGRQSAGHVSASMEGDADVVIGVGVLRIARQRFFESVDGSVILAVGVQPEAENLIGLGVLRVHTQRGPRLGNCIRAV